MQLTQDKIDALIKTRTLYIHGTLTLCVLDLVNGAQVVGQSNVIDPAKFNPLIGERVAVQNATDKLWELEGYALKTRGH